jgi:hypothetical protein
MVPTRVNTRRPRRHTAHGELTLLTVRRRSYNGELTVTRSIASLTFT